MDFPIIRPTLIYIIRLWAEPVGYCWVWRLSLQPVLVENPVTPVGFASLEAAGAFLANQMAQYSPHEAAF